MLGLQTQVVRRITDGPSFDLGYSIPHLDLSSFEYSRGDICSEPARRLWLNSLSVALKESPSAWVHVCPLPFELFDDVWDLVVSSGNRVSMQLHFSEIQKAKDSLMRAAQASNAVFMNQAEARMLFGGRSDLDLFATIERASLGAAFITTDNAVNVFVENHWVAMKSPRVEALDPTGGGDAFAGGVIGTLAQGGDLNTAVRLGALTAGVAVCGPSSQALGEHRLLPGERVVKGQ
jgi:sugar/nucleoside kinase (ribokinase family)